jgi:hypothetical protein
MRKTVAASLKQESHEFSLSECGQLVQMWNSASGAPQVSSSQYARKGQFLPQWSSAKACDQCKRNLKLEVQ